ncbi:MAG: hypothetical protein JOZ54_18215 [Acidobacteria bacterium]|nr:hypothetical protein [Acidobacteriota bacterium]
MRRAGTIALLILLATFLCLAADGDDQDLDLATVGATVHLAPPPPALDCSAVAITDGAHVRPANGVFHPPRLG